MLAATADMLIGHAASPAPSKACAGDALLVQAAQRGGRAAFAQLHDRFAPMVHGIVLARAPRSDANDLVQDAFVEALRMLHTLRDYSAFGPWIAAIARNLATQHVRHRRQVQLSSDDGQVAPAADLSDAEEAAKILTAIRALPESYSETLMLRLVEGMTGPQIAACTGLSPGSVRVNLHRGMHLLRRRLGLQEPS